MLIPISQKAKASETVSPAVRKRTESAFIKGVGLSPTQLYQELQILCVDFAPV